MKKSTPTRGQGRGLPLKGEAEKKSGRGRSGARRLAVPTLPAGCDGKPTAKGGRVSRAKRTEAKPQAAADGPIPAMLADLAVPISQLHVDFDNARRHPERNIEAIMASLAKFGQQAPAVFVLRKGKKIIIKGNGLLAAAKALGWTRLAAVRSGLAEQDAKAYAIADNRTTDLSDFDEELLAAQLAELDEADYDLASIGFTDAEFQELFKDATGEGEDGEGNEGETASRKRGERTAVIIVGHLKFEMPRVEFDRWLAGLEAKVGNDPDRVVREIKRRMGLGGKK
jgi:hypothetical protein